MKNSGPTPPSGYMLHRQTLDADGNAATIDPPIPASNFRSLLAWCQHRLEWIKPRYFGGFDNAWFASKDYGEEWIAEGDHYVLVAEWDMNPADAAKFPGAHASGAIVWETYVGAGSSLDAVKRQREVLGNTYGRVRIAKLEFTNE